ncbi:MAG: hypothetical protein FGM15_03125 [Chthoniobacterales bacterium]|nr:hypothetical protein [Chthoniobacterales bacterium]
MTATYRCPHCDSDIAASDTNVATDIALCRACGKSVPFSSIAENVDIDAVDLASPPKGVRVSGSQISGIEITYRKLSPLVFFIIPLALLWTGLPLAMIYGPQIASGKFDATLSLAGLPFFIGALLMLWLIAFMLCGCRRIHIDRGQCEIFTGVGLIGRRRRIALTPESSVRLELSSLRVNNVPQRHVVISTDGQTVKFGATLPENVRTFFAAVLSKASQAQ